MRPLFVMLIVFAGFFLASIIAVYSYGRFAKRVRGEPSHALPVQPDQTPLDHLVAPLLHDRPGETGMALVSDNLDAFAVRALSARLAGRSLDLQYYIWEHGLTGRLLVDEVLRAADRGVRVRMLLDDINTRGYDKTYLALDDHPNITVRLFNPSRNRGDRIRRGIEMLLRAFRVTRRMHNKAWIADGRVAIVGGRNIGDAYFDADETSNFRDLDLVLVGPATGETETVFDRFWKSDAAIPITALGKRRPHHLPRLRERLGRLASEERVRPYLERSDMDEVLRDMLADQGKLHWTSRAKIVWDPPEKAEGGGEQDWLMHALRPSLLSVRSRLEIISPYFIPGEAFTRELVRMAQNQVRVSILTNSLAATDVAAVHGAYLRCRHPLVSAGIALFELKPYQHRAGISLFGSSSASLHTKAFTVDERTGFIGSMNFDPRSVSLNSEMGVLFEQPELVAQVRVIFDDETSAQKSYRVRTDQGRIVWHDEAASHAVVLDKEPQASVMRRIIALVISFLPVQSQL